MKLVVLSVDVPDVAPNQKLDSGEHIVTRVVELDLLMDELKGNTSIDNGSRHVYIH